MSLLTNTDIAETWDALGQHEKATVYRWLDEPDPDAITVEELSDSIAEILREVADVKGSKHDGECWKRHAPRLAERLYTTLGYLP